MEPDDRPLLNAAELRQRLERWFAQGRAQAARYLAVGQDTWDYQKGDHDFGLYPLYVASKRELQALLAEYARPVPYADHIVDVFDLDRELDEQLREQALAEYHYFR